MMCDGCSSAACKDELRQVRLHHADSVMLQRAVQVNLFGGHALALDQGTHAMTFADFLNVLARFLRIARKKEMAAVPGDTLGKPLNERLCDWQAHVP